jgi:hypothetical protein
MLRRNNCERQRSISEHTGLFLRWSFPAAKSPTANKVPNRIGKSVKKCEKMRHFLTAESTEKIGHEFTRIGMKFLDGIAGFF